MVSVQRVWFITVIASPTIYWISYASQKSDDFSEFFSFFPVVLTSALFGLFFSMPTMGLFHLVNQRLFEKNFNHILSKVLLSVVLTTGILTTFFLIGGSLLSPEENFPLSGSYLFCSLTALWFFSKNEEKKNVVL